MDKKYLDYNGLLYFWQKLKNEFKDIDYVATGANVYLTGYTSGSTGDIASSDTVNVALSKLETKADNAVTSAADAATNVRGRSSDTSSAITVYGARALAQSALDAIGLMHGIEYTVVQSLPATGDSKYIYLLAHNHGTGDVYDEYIWVASANKFEKIGNTDIDLTGYLLSSELVAITNTEIDTIVAS